VSFRVSLALLLVTGGLVPHSSAAEQQRDNAGTPPQDAVHSTQVPGSNGDAASAELSKSLAENPLLIKQRVIDLIAKWSIWDAQPLAEAYTRAMRARYGERHLEYARALSLLAEVYRGQSAAGRTDAAERLYLQARAVLEATVGASHESALVLNNLALLYCQLGRYAEA
jgi:hypothetical protein